MAIREKAGVISKKIEGNPLSEEKVEAQKKEESLEAEATSGGGLIKIIIDGKNNV